MPKSNTPTARTARTIRSNVVDMEALVVVKRSIYPWEKLIPQKDDKPDGPARNFFVECKDREEAAKMRSSINSSGQNYFLKRKIPLTPVITAGVLPDGTFGVYCLAVADGS